MESQEWFICSKVVYLQASVYFEHLPTLLLLLPKPHQLTEAPSLSISVLLCPPLRLLSLYPCQVAVVDEIQMLADEARGWAWTRAVMGLAVDEVRTRARRGGAMR